MPVESNSTRREKPAPPASLFAKLRGAAQEIYAGLVRLYSFLRLFPYAVLISIIALGVSIYSTRYAIFGMKAAQRAYLTYQIAVTNGATVIDSVAKDKDFFMTYQITITNMGNTPAELITPKLNVIPDPDRRPLMITFPTTPFDLGPKESRTLTGQAMFQHVFHARQIPGFSTGLNGELEYRDVFGDPGSRQVCYQLIFQNSLTGGFCGSVIQQLEITDRGVRPNP